MPDKYTEEIEIISGQLEAVLDSLESIRIDAERETGNKMIAPCLALELLINRLTHVVG